ncbi:MAG: DUF4178 domain-containing protein [Hylemonella sp.]|nr:DUF4178 domain-containing protein [Hylemonella sp.]
MTSPGTQRIYRALCPGCGAPVEFRSAQSTHAVCAYCQSTVVREGEKLVRLGKMAELFDDHSPLRLMMAGRHGKDSFTLVGRLQYRYRGGTWNEWHALLDAGGSHWLGEDNGAYVYSRPASLNREVPDPAHFKPGMKTAVNGRTFTVSSRETVTLIAAQGELPHLPMLGQPFEIVELRSEDGRVLSIDYGPRLAGEAPQISLGQPVRLDALHLDALDDAALQEEKGRQFNCPHCGAPVAVKLAASKSITCSACNSLIDLSRGLGGEIRSAIQAEPVQPLIDLGSLAQLQGVKWQVVGYQHRMGHEAGEPDDRFGWSEYLLYNRKRGFQFLVDADDGWSLVRPITGAPGLSQDRATARYLGTSYRLKESYQAETNYVTGEFYWQVHRGQISYNQDYAAGRHLLSMEQDGPEITWSAGSQMDSGAVVTAFRLQGREQLFKREDAGPLSADAGRGALKAIVMVLVLFGLMQGLTRCAQSCDPSVEDCSASNSRYRSSGGAWGGSSSGGWHK